MKNLKLYYLFRNIQMNFKNYFQNFRKKKKSGIRLKSETYIPVSLHDIRASTSYFFPTFSYFFKIFLFIPIFASKFLFFPIFSLIWNKTYRYLHFCSYMTIGATVDNVHARIDT